MTSTRVQLIRAPRARSRPTSRNCAQDGYDDQPRRRGRRHELVATHEGLPAGLSPADDEVGWREALARLAALVEH